MTAKRMDTRLPLLAALVLLAITDPARPQTDPVVARLGDREISVEQFDRMAAKLLDGPYRQLEAAAPQARKDLLQVMVDKELLLAEAVARGLDRDPQVAHPLARLEGNLLVKRLYDSQAFAPVDLSDEEVERLFREGGYDEEVRFSHIMTPTAADAHRLLEKLQQGASFERLAQEHSVHLVTARRQGDMGYVPLAHMLPEVRDAVLELQPDQVSSSPVRSRYGFHLFRLTDRRPVELSQRETIVRRQLDQNKRAEQIAAYLDHLKRRYALDCDSGRYAPDRPDAAVCRWRDGQLTAAAFDSAQIDDDLDDDLDDDPDDLAAALETVAARRLAETEARRLGLHRDQAVAEPLRRKREELLIERLKRQETAAITVTDAQIKAHFEAYPELYGPRPTVRIQEIFVADEETAQQLRRRLDAGEAMTALAARFHTRPQTKAQGGSMWLVNRTNALLGPLAPAALDAPVGQLIGPLKVPGGYSLCRVEERKMLPARKLAEAQRSIETFLLLKTKNERMERLLQDLRTRYAAQLQIFPEALALTLGGGP